ncbi:interleukin-15 isoform X5 [Rattus norvegicus]|uniref:interleukin-15 isoform X5 n=1 Tax=Rattus norvegicus TaxID=10116 RepID=UPI002FD8548A
MQATCELRPTPCETSQKAKAFQDTQQLRPTAQGVETALGLSVALQVLHPGDLAVAESCGHLLGLGLPGWKALGGSRGSPGLFGLFAPCASIAHAGFRPASCTFQPEPDGESTLTYGPLALQSSVCSWSMLARSLRTQKSMSADNQPTGGQFYVAALKSSTKQVMRAGAMAQRLRALTDLPEVLSSNPRTTWWLTRVMGSDALFWCV